MLFAVEAHPRVVTLDDSESHCRLVYGVDGKNRNGIRESVRKSKRVVTHKLLELRTVKGVGNASTSVSVGEVESERGSDGIESKKRERSGIRGSPLVTAVWDNVEVLC